MLEATVYAIAAVFVTVACAAGVKSWRAWQQAVLEDCDDDIAVRRRGNWLDEGNVR